MAKKKVESVETKNMMPPAPPSSEDMNAVMEALVEKIKEEKDDEECNSIHCGRPSSSNDTDITFVVNKKFGEYIEYTCPICGEVNKLLYNKFEEDQYIDYENCKCETKILLKLDFEPVIRTFTPSEFKVADKKEKKK
jgi:DNA-directed RNA polymerase subunit RPC12/RpoP